MGDDAAIRAAGGRRVRRPALPHERQLRLASPTRSRSSEAARDRGTHPPRDHRPRPDRRRPARPRRGDPRDHRHRRRGGQDDGRRPRSASSSRRRSRPACRRPRRSPAPAPRAGWSGSRTRSTATAARSARPRTRSGPSPRSSTGSRPSTPGSSSARATSGPPSSHGRPGSRAWPSPMPTRCWRSASRRRGSRATRRRRPGCCAALARPRACVPGPATYFVRALTPLAKLVQRGRGRGRVRPRSPGCEPAPGEPPRPGRIAPRERGAPADVRHPTPGGRCTTAPPPASRRSPSTRSRWGGACASRARSSRSPSRSCVIVALRGPQLAPAGARSRPSSRRPTRCCVLGRLRHLLPGLPAARLPLVAPPARGRGVYCPTKDATEIIFLSWLVNCVVPAKLGDVYRAYLLKINSDASLSRTFGTIFIERVLDLFVIVILGLAAGFWSFRGGLPPGMQIVVGLGIGVMIVLALGLLFLRNVGGRLLAALPLPRKEWVLRAVRALRGGRLRRVRPRTCSRACSCSPGSIWMTEVAAPLVRGPGPGVPGRLAGHLGRGLRRADRVAPDRRPAQPGRAGDRRGGARSAS